MHGFIKMRGIVIALLASVLFGAAFATTVSDGNGYFH